MIHFAKGFSHRGSHLWQSELSKNKKQNETIVLKNSIDYHQYQQIVDFFATIGVEIENPYGEVTLQDDEVLLQALDEGITQADNGLLIPHNEVMQEIDLLLTTM